MPVPFPIAHWQQAAPVPIVFADDFNRADSTTVGTLPNADSGWNNYLNGAQILDNMLAPTTDQSCGVQAVHGGGPNQEVSFDFWFGSSAPTYNELFGYLRQNLEETEYLYYTLIYDGGNDLMLYFGSSGNGPASEVLHETVISFDPLLWHTIRFVMDARVISLYLDNVLVGSGDDPYNFERETSLTQFGMYGNTSSRMDNVRIETR